MKHPETLGSFWVCSNHFSHLMLLFQSQHSMLLGRFHQSNGAAPLRLHCGWQGTWALSEGPSVCSLVSRKACSAPGSPASTSRSATSSKLGAAAVTCPLIYRKLLLEIDTDRCRCFWEQELR